MSESKFPAACLGELLAYCADTGILTWRPRDIKWFSTPTTHPNGQTPEHRRDRWNSKNAGNQAGTLNRINGRLHVSVEKNLFRAHRVAWALHYGSWPTGEIDHIDHDPTNNALSNLRLATRETNGRNISLHRTNTSGVTGVTWNKDRGRWVAQIHMHGKGYFLGHYESKADAAAARKAANEKYGFHANHGVLG